MASVSISRRSCVAFLASAKSTLTLQRRAEATQAMSVKRLDAHLHVWASKEDAQSGKYPFAVSSNSNGVCEATMLRKGPALGVGR